ncbi:serine carboxypeptidase 3-like isoform X3 [Apium graveolens]|uniref:serine carboxypeptidase 3-like isoform X3 n=1 Tax=Apium graveolens TaxID=4045 RepID=UPI003D7943DE
MSLSWNAFGWDKVSNIIYVDQPVGTGFSYSSDFRDIPSNEQGVSNDLYDFLQGFSVGNGNTDPAIQYKAYTAFALENKLITKTDYVSINKMIPKCERGIELCATKGNNACVQAYEACRGIYGSIVDINGNINVYDIRKECKGEHCYDFSRMDTFLNLTSVREVLGVQTDFISCSKTVKFAMRTDRMKDLEVGIPELLEDGIKVLIYAGEYDLKCNWLGNSRWVHAMKWSGQKKFVGSPTVPFVVNGSKAGEMQSYGPLTFLKVHDAGHMVPMDQPKAALKMLTRWMQGKLATK